MYAEVVFYQIFGALACLSVRNSAEDKKVTEEVARKIYDMMFQYELTPKSLGCPAALNTLKLMYYSGDGSEYTYRHDADWDPRSWK